MRVALVCIAKNEDAYIQEWLDYHLKLGVDSIFIYENDWRSGIEREGVYTISYDGPQKQQNAYNNWLFNYAEGYDWVAFLDLDEFLVLHKHKDIKHFLTEYGEIPDDVDAIAVNWMMFGDCYIVERDKTLPVLDHFILRGRKPDRHIKVIVKLNGSRCMISPHCTYGFWIDTNGNVGKGQNNFDGTCDVIQVNHYFCKTLPEYKEKVARGRADWHEPRPMEDFDFYNQNEVLDFTARDFKWKQQ